MITTRRYADRIVHDAEQRAIERWRAQENAVRIASEGLERRLAILNDLQTGTVSRSEYEAKHRDLEKQIDELTRWRANLMGRLAIIGFIAALGGAALGAEIAHLLGG